MALLAHFGRALLGLLLLGACSAERRVLLDGGLAPWRRASSAGWALASDAGDGKTGSLVVTVALKLPSGEVSRMELELAELSDPASPRYGEPRWNASELASRLAPPAEAIATIQHWISEEGGILTGGSANGGFVTAVFGRQTAERCFGVEVRRYTHTSTGASSFCSTTAAYSVPADVAPLIDFVAGLTRLPLPTATSTSTSRENEGGDFKTTPALIRQLYALPVAGPPKTANIQAICAFNNESFTPEVHQIA
jgi:hypothetical protein